MSHREIADAQRMEEAIVLALREILQHQDPDLFLAWARARLPELLGLADSDLSPEEEAHVATLLGQAIWNATPLPNHGFQHLPLAPPDPDAPCVCGSGAPYWSCCGALADVPELPPDLLWELLLEEIPGAGLRAALASGAVPSHLLAKVADRWLDEDHPGRAVALLEPLFADLSGLDGRFDAALDALCDAYDRLDHWRKGRAFLERIARDGPRDLRAAAWRRLCTQCIDEGDFVQAQEAFAQAQRNAPDSPRTALLEVTLLAAERKDAIAALRAHFWRRKLERVGFSDEPFMSFLADATADPQAALVASQADSLDPPLVQLRAWVAVLDARPLPTYELEPYQEAPTVALPGQLSLFPDGEFGALRRPGTYTGASWRLRPPRPVRQLEQRWHQIYPAIKPYSTQLALMDDGDPWAGEGWLRFLAQNPLAADSLDVLDDLATALYAHPESSLPWMARVLLLPLLTRAAAILESVLPPGGGQHIPWSAERNRPALRLLFRLYLWHAQAGDGDRAAAVLERLLALNPQDNHGVRAELMNHLLRSGEDLRALELAQSFPGDILADLAYGEVLALYRLGDQVQARRALREAVRNLPRIPHYLTRKRIKQPPPEAPWGHQAEALGLAPGGEDQAWLYREAMRDVWEAEPGILAWLKRHVRRGKG